MRPAFLVSCLLLMAGLGTVSPPVWAEGASVTGLEAWLGTLDRSDAATARLATSLQTLSGRAALGEVLKTIRAEAMATRRLAALERVLAEVGTWGPGSAWHARTARRVVREDLRDLASAIRALRESYRSDSAVARDLGRFLEREDAPRLLYEHLLVSRYRPLVAGGKLGRWLAEADNGRLHVPKALRDSSEAALRTAERGSAKRGRSELRHGGADEILRSARYIASRLSTAEDALLARWRAVLTSPRVLHLGEALPPRRPKASSFLLKHTPIGRALFTDANGRTRMNPHAAGEVDRLLRDIANREAERAPLRARIEAFWKTLESGELRDRVRSEPGRLLLVDMALREAGESPIDPWPRWVQGTFERGSAGRRLTGDAREAARLLVARAQVIERELEAEGARSVVDPASLVLTTDGLGILRSSIFYNPRTAAGRWSYLTEFDDHHTARLFGTYGWNAKVSKDFADYERRIRKQKPYLKSLAKTHAKIVIHISGVPPWLSSHKGTGKFEAGGWDDKQTHPPKDLAVWRRMIRVLAETFREAPCERYYEFWNEPDLKYWQGTLEDFLALYEATVRVVREVDPEGRVGGVATNQWDGRIHKKTGSDILNLELIRFAARRDVPLDFVSWHHFGRPVAHIRQAKEAYLAEWQKAGHEGEPEWLVTEWSMPGRGTVHGGALFGEAMLGFWEAGVDAQTASCWEEFHAKPDPKGFAPWGLITQQGHRHGTYYVHRFIDRWMRESEGATVVRRDDKRILAISRKANGVWDVLIWQRGNAPRLKAAWALLEKAGFASKDARIYATVNRLERALKEGGPVAERWRVAFEAAGTALAAHPIQTERLVVEFKGAKRLEVLYAESVHEAHRTLHPAVRAGTFTVPLARDEVVRVVLRVH